MSSAQVLIVDDDPQLRGFLASLARAQGFATVEAADGEEALAQVRRQLPNLVVTDLHMPRLSGRQLVRLLRGVAGLEDTPIMVVTADDSRSARIELLEAGADEFVVKPVESDEFISRLKSMARRCDLIRHLDAVTNERDAVIAELERRNEELERLTIGLVGALERANELNDADTGNHIRRVCEYSAMLARSYGCEDDYIDQVRRYAGLHDVGKVGIRDSILKKPGRLTSAEYEEMKTHTLIGGELLASAALPLIARNIATYHHEKWDGSGYPHGLAGEAIPLEARIVAVADVFDALVNKRCYKEAFGFDRSRSIMEKDAGSHFDPVLVDLFFQHLDEVRRVLHRYSDEPVPDEGTEGDGAWG